MSVAPYLVSVRTLHDTISLKSHVCMHHTCRVSLLVSVRTLYDTISVKSYVCMHHTCRVLCLFMMQCQSRVMSEWLYLLSIMTVYDAIPVKNAACHVCSTLPFEGHDCLWHHTGYVCMHHTYRVSGLEGLAKQSAWKLCIPTSRTTLRYQANGTCMEPHLAGSPDMQGRLHTWPGDLLS